MSRRTPQYLRCELCAYMWVGVWLPITPEQLAKVLEAAHCPMCCSDSSYHALANHPTPVARAVDSTDTPVPVVLTLPSVQSDLANDIRLLMCKVQLGDPMSACQHSRAVTFLTKLPAMIDNAAGYVRAQQSRIKPENMRGQN